MTNDKIIAMAKQAGIEFEPMQLLCGDVVLCTSYSVSIDRMAHVIALVEAREREACAVMLEARGNALCDSAGSDREQFAQGCEADHCADLIRARGQKEGV